MSKVYDLHWRPVRLCSKASFRTTTEPPMVSQAKLRHHSRKNTSRFALKTSLFVII